MKEQFVTYEIALKLKELGFDEPCFGYYDEESFYKDVIACSEFDLNYAGGRNVFHENFHAITNNELDELGSFSMKYDTEESYDRWGAPLWQQCEQWFRDKYNIHITITSQSQESWQWHIQFPHDSLNKMWEEDFYTYEEAREQAILKAIELCQKEK